MKLKLKDLNSNPFKKDINGGKLNDKIISKIRSNIKELGLMGSIPIFKKDNKYFLISHHHRVEALKQEFGKNFEVEVLLHDYSDDQVLRGMIVENLTQRSDEMLEVADNLMLIKKHLQSACSSAEQAKRKDVKGINDNGSVRDIASWLNLNGDVMSIGKISEYLKVAENLDRRLLAKAESALDGKSEGTISIEDAKNLARLPKDEQFKMKDVLDETGLDYKEKAKLLTQYLNAPEDIKKSVIDGDINIVEISEAVVDKQLENKETVKREFIPNFEQRISDFSTQVNKLQQQVAIFKNVFRSPNFIKVYNGLDFKRKNDLHDSIFDIKKRIQLCNDEVDYFIKTMR